jgi:hypothetical protein
MNEEEEKIAAEEAQYMKQLRINHARTPDEWQKMEDAINAKKEKQKS